MDTGDSLSSSPSDCLSKSVLKRRLDRRSQSRFQCPPQSRPSVLRATSSPLVAIVVSAFAKHRRGREGSRGSGWTGFDWWRLTDLGPVPRKHGGDCGWSGSVCELRALRDLLKTRPHRPYTLIPLQPFVWRFFSSVTIRSCERQLQRTTGFVLHTHVEHSVSNISTFLKVELSDTIRFFV